MLRLSPICNALAIAAVLTLDSKFCCCFQIRTLQQQPTARTARTHTSDTSLSIGNINRRYKTTRIYVIKSEDLLINGSKSKSTISFFEGIDVGALPEGGELSSTMTTTTVVEADSPPMSFDKFVTMQEKRAVVTIRYSGDAGLKPYFLTIAKKLKHSHPDVVIERRILPSIIDGNYEATFEVLVEGKVVIGKSRHRKVSRNGNNDVHDIIGRRSVYVSMNELDLAISRARRKHRPTTVYGGGSENDTSIILGGNKLRNSNSSNKGYNIDNTTGMKTDWSD